MWKVSDHNGTLLGTFHEIQEALDEAASSKAQTGSPATVEQITQPVCIGCEE